MSSTTYSQKRHFLLAGTDTTAIYSPLNKVLMKCFLETFCIETVSMATHKNTNKTQKTGQILI